MFVEWMMMLPEGRVSAAPVSKTAKIRILGNGVVPFQAAHALRQIVARLDAA